MEFEVQMTSMTLDFSSDSFLLHKLLENCFEIICREALHEGMCLWEFMWAPSQFGWVLPNAALFPFRVMLGSGQTLSFFHGSFHWGRGGRVVLVGVCVYLCLPEPPRGLSCALQSCFEGRGKRNREKEMIDSSPLDFCC